MKNTEPTGLNPLDTKQTFTHLTNEPETTDPKTLAAIEKAKRIEERLAAIRQQAKTNTLNLTGLNIPDAE